MRVSVCVCESLQCLRSLCDTETSQIGGYLALWPGRTSYGLHSNFKSRNPLNRARRISSCTANRSGILLMHCLRLLMDYQPHEHSSQFKEVHISILELCLWPSSLGETHPIQTRVLGPTTLHAYTRAYLPSGHLYLHRPSLLVCALPGKF